MEERLAVLQQKLADQDMRERQDLKLRTKLEGQLAEAQNKISSFEKVWFIIDTAINRTVEIRCLIMCYENANCSRSGNVSLGSF